jgi:hypothetical protein
MRARKEKEDRQQTEPKQSRPVWATGTTATTVDNMFRVATVVKQIMTDSNDAASEEEKVLAITKKILKLIKGQWPLEYTGSSILHLIQMTLEGSVLTSVNSCKFSV